jgi:hypothetical protein
MSTLSDKLQRWRRLGLLKYLAVELGVTHKQVTRYWDRDWIPNSYRTPGGTRRVRYTEDTVEQLRRTVDAAKQTNREIRYRINEIMYCGTEIDVKGCNSMADLFKRAKAAGLTERDARIVAYRPRLETTVSPDDLAWDSLRAKECTSEQEAAESTRLLDLLPLPTLMAAASAPDFRKEAKTAWSRIQPDLKGEAPDRVELLRHVLSQPNRRSFFEECNKAMELDNRIMNRTDEELRRATKWASDDPNQVRLNLAALRIRRSQQRPSASALAKSLGLSRPALYRVFGKETIQDVLKAIRHDPVAAEAKRNDKWAEGKTNERGTRTALRHDQ